MIRKILVLGLLMCLIGQARPTVTTNITTDMKEDDGVSKDLGDEILREYHDEMRKSLLLRERIIPGARELRTLDMTAFLKKKSRIHICSYGWKNGKFGRLFGKYIKLANAMLKWKYKKKGAKKKKPLVPLYNRFHKREPDPENMNCMLYAKIYDVQRFILSKILQVTITFMSPCMNNTITRVFLVKKIKLRRNTILILKFGKFEYFFEFDEIYIKKGYGINRKEIFNSFKLLNYYAEYVPKWRWRRRRRRMTRSEILMQFERLKQSTGVARKLIDNHIRKPRKLEANRVKLVKKGKDKRAVRMLYKNWRFRWLPTIKTGTKYVILPSRNRMEPWHPYDLIKNIWTGNNPTHCVHAHHFTMRIPKIMYRDIAFRIGWIRRIITIKIKYRIPIRYFKMVCTI